MRILLPTLLLLVACGDKDPDDTSGADDRFDGAVACDVEGALTCGAEERLFKCVDGELGLEEDCAAQGETCVQASETDAYCYQPSGGEGEM